VGQRATDFERTQPRKLPALDRSRRLGHKASVAFLTNLDLETARSLAAHFGLDVARVEALAAGSVNSNFKLICGDGSIFFARIYEEQDARGASAEAVLLGELARAGVPVAAPLAPRGLEHHPVAVSGKPFAVFPWVPGEDLCHARVTPQHCSLLGGALAEVHLATARLSHVPAGRFRVSDLLTRLDFIEAETQNYQEDVARIRSSLERHEANRNSELPRGLTHGDLFRDNVLWEGERLSALLDFESASEGPLVYDLMVCLLAWCYTDSFNLARAAALVSGYEAKRRLTRAERQAAANEGGLACLRFATTRITDFAMRTPPGAQPLRAYQRFLARLDAIEAGGLASIFGV
jgi:homoserine kinase type II